MTKKYLEDDLGLRREVVKWNGMIFYSFGEGHFFLAEFGKDVWHYYDPDFEVNDGSIYAYQIISDKKIFEKLYL